VIIAFWVLVKTRGLPTAGGPPPVKIGGLETGLITPGVPAPDDAIALNIIGIVFTTGGCTPGGLPGAVDVIILGKLL
jgi:hypothetical protein